MDYSWSAYVIYLLHLPVKLSASILFPLPLLPPRPLPLIPPPRPPLREWPPLGLKGRISFRQFSDSEPTYNMNKSDINRMQMLTWFIKCVFFTKFLRKTASVSWQDEKKSQICKNYSCFTTIFKFCFSRHLTCYLSSGWNLDQLTSMKSQTFQQSKHKLHGNNDWLTRPVQVLNH